jgi:D-alanyl-D-alanine carboxypeptidase
MALTEMEPAMIATRRALLGSLAALPFAGGCPALAHTRPADAAAEAALDAVFAGAAPPALAAGIVTREGLSWAGVRGVRRAGTGDAATLDDRWHLGSNTKAMTAAVFARLVEAGHASWDLTLAGAFPTLTLDPAWRDVPLTRLMTHRSGLVDSEVIGLAWLTTARSDRRSLPEQRAAIAAAALARPPSGRVGGFAYSNAGYIIVGAAIEAISGQAWEAVMGAELFQPLGLTSAGFGAPPDPNAWGHRSVSGKPLPMDPANPGADNPLALGPAGTAHMTVADNGRWVQAMIGGGPEGWLGADSLSRLTTTTETAPAYAPGWITLPASPFGRLGATIAHEGSNAMWHAIVVASPERGLGFIACSNDSEFGGLACRALVQRLGDMAPAG